MAKLGMFAFLSTIAAVLAIASVPSTPTASAADPCKTTAFKTELVRDACTKGGQKAAKDAMKAWMKEKKIKTCNQCHAKLAPSYELKKDGVAQFSKNGGKLVDTKATMAPPKTAPATK